MWRTVLGVVGGLVAWVAVATVLDIGLRDLLPGYAQVERAMTFTLAMKLSRLALAVLASLAAGVAVRLIAPDSRWAPWVVGGLLLAMFLPVHISIWPRFPIWYHLFFLITLAPFVALGAQLRLVRGRAGSGAAAGVRA